ncbi:MAG TPA: hypothetical protein VIY26_17065 [Acidimicrobiales bacterium]
MFRRDHRDEDLPQRVDHLMTAVVLTDPEARLAALAAHVAPDVVYVSPSAVFDGPGGLSEAFERLRRPDRQPAALRRTSPLDQHHGYFRFTWERVERGAAVMSGWAFGSLDESGAIDRIVAFEGLEPRAPEGSITT